MVDATGFLGSFASAVSMVRDAGTVVEVGAFVDMGPEAFNPAVICGRSLTVVGVGGEDLLAYPGTLALLARHAARIPFAAMISHAFGVSDAALALETSFDAQKATKVLISDELRIGSSPHAPEPAERPHTHRSPARSARCAGGCRVSGWLSCAAGTHGVLPWPPSRSAARVATPNAVQASWACVVMPPAAAR